MNEEKNKNSKNQIVEDDSGTGLPPIICFMCLFFGICSVHYKHQLPFSKFVTCMVIICFFSLAFSSLMLAISDKWFVGKKFDHIYMKIILGSKNKEAKYQLPYARFYPGIRPYRVIVYSWALIGNRDKLVFGDDDLNKLATPMDKLMAWLTIIPALLCIIAGFIGGTIQMFS